MDIPAVTLEVVKAWANVASVPDLSVELCALFMQGRLLPCDNGVRQDLINKLRNALAGVVDLRSLRPSDLVDPGNIKTVLSLNQFIAANIIPN